MNEQDQVQRRIIEAVTRFENQLMAVRPDTVAVSLSRPYLIVTLRGAICEAERRYAQDRRSRGLLERLYVDIFNAAKPELETAIGNILGRRIRRSRISIDPVLGDAILVFVFGEDSEMERTEPSGATESPAK